MAVMDFDYAQKAKTFRQDGFAGNGWAIVAAEQHAAPSGAGNNSFNSGTAQCMVLVSCSIACLVRVDGSAATATQGLAMTAGSTVQIPCKASTTGAVQVYVGAACSLSVQFLTAV